MKMIRKYAAGFLLLVLSLTPILTLAKADGDIASATMDEGAEENVLLFSPVLRPTENTPIFTTEPGILTIRIDNECDQPVQISVIWTEGRIAQRQTEIIDPTGSVTFGKLLEAEAAMAEIEGRSLVEEGLCPLTLTLTTE